MLWTGGKDCSLALYEAGRDGYDVRCLVTFAPLNPNFLAHPPVFIKMQAQALALPHYILSIREPFEKSYETALGELRDKMSLHTVITGDIAEVNGSPNWIRERSRPVGMNVHTPLWGRDRLALLQQQLASGFKAIRAGKTDNFGMPGYKSHEQTTHRFLSARGDGDGICPRSRRPARRRLARV